MESTTIKVFSLIGCSLGCIATLLTIYLNISNHSELLKSTDFDAYHNSNIDQLITFQQFVHEFSYQIHTASISDNTINISVEQISIHNISFPLHLTAQSMVDILSNKTIGFFGDSLNFFIVSYLIHSLFWCHIQHQYLISLKCPCERFCENMESKQLLLDRCSLGMILNRDHLKNILESGYLNTSGTMIPHETSCVYFSQFNLTVYLNYHWASDFNSVYDMLHDFKTITTNINFDIIFHNMVSMHLPYHIRTKAGAINISLSMIDAIEIYMNKITEIAQELPTLKCFLFGPVNPCTKYNSMELLSIQTHVLFQNYFVNVYRDELENISVQLLLKDLSAPYILSYIDYDNHSDWIWSKHLNYMWKHSVSNDIEWMKIRSKCYVEFKKYKHMYGISFLNYEHVTKNMMDNICLLYAEGLGNNMFHHRMKDFVYRNYNRNGGNKLKVFYLDQYTLYQRVDHFAKHVYNVAHYPRLQKIAWINILNMIHNGCS